RDSVSPCVAAAGVGRASLRRRAARSIGRSGSDDRRLHCYIITRKPKSAGSKEITIMSCVLVTGCSSGIGFAKALTLGRAGHRVYATMRTPGRAAPVLRESIEKEKLPISILALDVDSDESVANAVSAIRSEAGPIDVLVNNAGIERMGSIEELPFEAFR